MCGVDKIFERSWDKYKPSELVDPLCLRPMFACNGETESEIGEGLLDDCMIL